MKMKMMMKMMMMMMMMMRFYGKPVHYPMLMVQYPSLSRTPGKNQCEVSKELIFCIKKNLKDLPQPLDSPLIDGIFTRFTPPSSTHQTMENSPSQTNGTIPRVAPEKFLLGRPIIRGRAVKLWVGGTGYACLIQLCLLKLQDNSFRTHVLYTYI